MLHRGRGGDSVATADETIEVLQHWLGDPGMRERTGAAARTLVQRGLGAGERSYELVMELIDGKSTGVL
jgi:hypothetical protein